MALLRQTCLISLLAATTQLTLHSPDDTEDPTSHGIMEFGGIFDIVDTMRQHMEVQQQTEEEEKKGNLLGQKSSDSWPAGSWKAPLSPTDSYGGNKGIRWHMPDTRQCTDADMKVIHYWALKQAKTRLPQEGKNATFGTGTCYKNNYNKWGGLNVDNYVKCYQRFYDISTPCATCIGSVYHMAAFNWSEPCYNFCYGRPSKRDGAHWCWEDCQSCMWYIGRRLSICYGEPYDIVCRYAKELGKEGWFEKNGINPTKR